MSIACFTHIPVVYKFPGPEILTFDSLEVFAISNDTAYRVKSGDRIENLSLLVIGNKFGSHVLKAGTSEIIFKVRQGVRCHPHPRSPHLVTVECIKDLSYPISFACDIISFDLQFRGERGNLPASPGGIFFTVSFPEISKFSAPLPTDDLRAARIFSINEPVPISLSAKCSGEVGVGEKGVMTVTVRQELPGGIPLKGAWRILTFPDSILFVGGVAGMKMFMPGLTEIKIDFFAVIPGELFLPGVEIELLPTGETARLEIGPRTFAVPVVQKYFFPS